MFELLKGTVDYKALNRPAHIEYHRVFDTVKETGEYHFLHGVAVDQWKGRLVAGFAFNNKEENSITEQLFIRWSGDDGRTWTRAESIAPPASYANSHSVFLPQEDVLWCFGPRFLGHGGDEFIGLQMEAWRYDGSAWKPMGIVGNDFWPLGAPTRLENGNWLISGCDTKWKAAIAISHGDDLLHWETVKPDVGEEIFTEAAAWANGNEVLMVMRNQSAVTDGKYHAAVSLSMDYGKTFGACELSNLSMATTKPFCGKLNDGRPYLVFNESIEGKNWSRERMLLGIGERGSFSISKVYVLDEGYACTHGRLNLSYPYAVQIGDRLYVAYSYESTPGTSYNHNDAMLAIVDISSLD